MLPLDWKLATFDDITCHSNEVHPYTIVMVLDANEHNAIFDPLLNDSSTLPIASDYKQDSRDSMPFPPYSYRCEGRAQQNAKHQTVLVCTRPIECEVGLVAVEECVVAQEHLVPWAKAWQRWE